MTGTEYWGWLRKLSLSGREQRALLATELEKQSESNWLAALLHDTLSIGRQLKCAALNRGRYLYSAGWPSRWALAHILVQFYDDTLAPPGEYDKMDCGRQPSRKWHKPPPLFGPCLLWPNGCPSQLLLSTCTDTVAQKAWQSLMLSTHGITVTPSGE